MSSLWTPGGEHRVPDQHEQRAPAPSEGGAGEAGPPAGGPASAAQAAADLARFEEQLLAVPAADVVADHCYGLFELAALHLRQPRPRFDEARMAIDALAAVVEGLGERLGEAAPSLRAGLAELRLAFVQLAGAAGGAASP